MKLTGIYRIKNIITNKIYIGSSKDIKDRWSKRKKELRYIYHSIQTKIKQRQTKIGKYDGIINHNSKLTIEQILEINIKYKTGLYSLQKFGKDFNVSKTCIRYNIEVNK